MTSDQRSSAGHAPPRRRPALAGWAGAALAVSGSLVGPVMACNDDPGDRLVDVSADATDGHADHTVAHVRPVSREAFSLDAGSRDASAADAAEEPVDIDTTYPGGTCQ